MIQLAFYKVVFLVRGIEAQVVLRLLNSLRPQLQPAAKFLLSCKKGCKPPNIVNDFNVDVDAVGRRVGASQRNDDDDDDDDANFSPIKQKF